MALSGGGVGSRLSRCYRGQLCRLPCLQYQPHPTEEGHGKIEILGKSDTKLCMSMAAPVLSSASASYCMFTMLGQVTSTVHFARSRLMSLRRPTSTFFSRRSTRHPAGTVDR